MSADILVPKKPILVDAQGKPLVVPDAPPKQEYKVIRMPAVKLKRPNRTGMMYDLEKCFGFIPKKIGIVMGEQNNSFQLCAIDDREEVKGGEKDTVKNVKVETTPEVKDGK